MLLVITSATIPMPGRINTYTSGWARNQNRCCHSSGLPPPAAATCSPPTTNPDGRKKLVPARRSISWKMAAAWRGGNASSSRNAVTSCDHTKNGRRKNVSPSARRWMMVTMKLRAPSSEEAIRKIMPTSQAVCPVVAMSARGGYEVQPELAAPPGSKKLVSITTPPITKAW